MTPDQTDNRATAERIAREVYEKWRNENGMRYSPLFQQHEDTAERAILCVLAGMAHRDRTSEREAASKALGYIYGQFAARPVVDKDVALAVVLHAVQSKEGYLAAEFDAGERVTEPKAAPVLTWHEVGLFKWGLADETGLIVGRADDCTGYVRGECIGRYVTREQCRDAVKRLAEQRGAER